MNKLLIFDLDGTLVDTLDDLTKAVNFSLKKHNFPTKTKEEVRKAIGNGTVKLIERSAPSNADETTLKELHSTFKKFYLNNIGSDTKPYKNISSVLFALKTKGYKLAVVSNKDQEATVDIINRLFPELFDYVQGSYIDKPKKPHPFLIDKVCDALKFDKINVTYIGDTNVDEKSAINAGLKYILVSYGYRTKQELLEQVKTRKIINDIKDLDFTL